MFLLCCHGVVLSQETESAPVAEKKTEGWFNSTELSLVFTEGNSNTETLGFKNTLTKKWGKADFRLQMDAVRSDTSDDRFLLLESGQTFLPGESPSIGASTLIKPGAEPDVEKYFLEGRYNKTMGGKKTWNVGGSWDRNEDSGILNRFIAFGGIGTNWKEGEKLQLHTTYAGSFTDREEETPDPEKEAQFPGLRATMDLDYQVLQSTALRFQFTGNLNLEDTSDYSLDSTGSVSVSMSSRMSLKTSVQFLFNSEPALEDLDVVARLELIDPDTIPGSGDEFFITVSEGGSEVVIGEDRARRDHLDTVFRTSLVITF